MRLRLIGVLVARRMAIALAILIVVSFATFSLLYLAPGSAVQALIGPHPATPQLIASLRKEFHLDQPFLVQYLDYVKGIFHLDFGTSVRTGEPVGAMLRQAAPVTVFLALYAFVLTIVVGVALGVFAALRNRTAVDRGIVGLSVVGISAPAFASGFLLMYVFAVVLGWFPAVGAGEGFSDRLTHLTLPAIALAISGAAFVVKLTRAAVVTALEQDYITFARARGLSQRRVVLAYALRNALIPIITASGAILAGLLTGTVLVEVTFGISGLGSLLIDSVNAKDVPVVQAVAVLFAIVIVMVNLLVDVCFIAVDPRIQLGRSGA